MPRDKESKDETPNQSQADLEDADNGESPYADDSNGRFWNFHKSNDGDDTSPVTKRKVSLNPFSKGPLKPYAPANKDPFQPGSTYKRPENFNTAPPRIKVFLTERLVGHFGIHGVPAQVGLRVWLALGCRGVCSQRSSRAVAYDAVFTIFIVSKPLFDLWRTPNRFETCNQLFRRRGTGVVGTAKNVVVPCTLIATGVASAPARQHPRTGAGFSTESLSSSETKQADPPPRSVAGVGMKGEDGLGTIMRVMEGGECSVRWDSTMEEHVYSAGKFGIYHLAVFDYDEVYPWMRWTHASRYKSINGAPPPIERSKELEILLGFRADEQLKRRVRYDKRKCLVS